MRKPLTCALTLLFWPLLAFLPLLAVLPANRISGVSHSFVTAYGACGAMFGFMGAAGFILKETGLLESLPPVALQAVKIGLMGVMMVVLVPMFRASPTFGLFLLAMCAVSFLLIVKIFTKKQPVDL
jgi:FtsH-binding integral membrane protein